MGEEKTQEQQPEVTETAVDTAQTDVSPAQTDVSPAQTDVSPAQTDVSPAQTDVPPAQTDVPPAQTDVPPVTKTVQPPEIQLNVNPATAMNLTVQEFEKKIAEAEAVVYDLKKQKAAYIYNTNIQALLASAQQQTQPV